MLFILYVKYKIQQPFYQPVAQSCCWVALLHYTLISWHSDSGLSVLLTKGGLKLREWETDTECTSGSISAREMAVGCQAPSSSALQYTNTSNLAHCCCCSVFLLCFSGLCSYCLFSFQSFSEHMNVNARIWYLLYDLHCQSWFLLIQCHSEKLSTVRVIP